MANPYLNAGSVALALQIGLAGVDAGDQGVTETGGITQGITDCCHRAISARSFLALRRAEDSVSRIEVHAKPPERARQDTGELGVHVFLVHAGRQVRLDSHGQGREIQRLSIEVVEQAQMQIAGLVRADEGVRLGNRSPWISICMLSNAP